MITQNNNKRKRLYVKFYSQWIFAKCNWYDFSIIKFDVMNDVMLGAFELHLAFVGICVDVEWIHDFGPRDDLSKKTKAWINRVKGAGQ